MNRLESLFSKLSPRRAVFQACGIVPSATPHFQRNLARTVSTSAEFLNPGNLYSSSFVLQLTSNIVASWRKASWEAAHWRSYEECASCEEVKQSIVLYGWLVCWTMALLALRRCRSTTFPNWSKVVATWKLFGGCCRKVNIAWYNLLKRCSFTSPCIQ